MYSEVKCEIECDGFFFKECYCSPRGKTTFLYSEKEKGILNVGISHLKVLGEKGSQGGDAGLGGAGGIGGYDGNSNILLCKKYACENSNQVAKDFRYSYGANGKPGRPGLGGLDGATAYRGFRVFPATYSPTGIATAVLFHPTNTFDSIYDRKEASLVRARDGSIYYNLNSYHQLKPKRPNRRSEYVTETEYLKFLSEMDKTFKNSRLLHQKFVQTIFEENVFQPTITNLIERTKVVNNLENRNILYYLKKEISDYYNNQTTLTLDEKLVLNYTSGAISSSINRFINDKEIALVVDLKQYLVSTLEHISKLKQLKGQNIRDIYRQNYENNLKAKIKEAFSFIGELQEDVFKSNEEINFQIGQLLRKVVVESKEEILRNDNNLLKTKTQLQKSLLLKKIFGTLKIACSVLTLLGPKGLLIGTIAHGGLGIAESFLNPGNTNQIDSLLAGTEKSVNGIINFIKQQNKDKIERKLKELETAEKIRKGSIDLSYKENSKKTIETRLEELPESVPKQKLTIEYFENVLINKQTSKENKALANQKVAEAKKKLDLAKEQAEKSNKNIAKVSVVMETAKMAAGLFNQVELGNNEIQLITQEIEKNADAYKNLGEFEDLVSEFQKSTLRKFENEANNFASSLNGSSLSALDFKNWKIKNILGDFKIQMLGIVKTFEGHVEIMNTITRLENTISTMIDIYTRIENHAQQIDFANFISDITNQELTIGIPVQYQKDINSLKKIIHEI